MDPVFQELKKPVDRQIGFQSNSSLMARENPLRSKSGGKTLMDFKSSFANNQTTANTDIQASRVLRHEILAETLASPSKARARSISPLRSSPSRNRWNFDSIGGTRMLDRPSHMYFNYKQQFTVTDHKIKSPTRTTVTEMRVHHGLQNTFRDSPKRAAMKNLSYSHLPPMPPHVMGGHNLMVENSPSRTQVIEHRVATRSPLREILVQEKHLMPSMQMAGHYAPSPPPPAGHMHLIVRKPEHHQDMFISGLQCEVNELKNRQQDYLALMEVYKQLEANYHDQVIDIQSMQVEQSGQIQKDRHEIETMIQELELVKVENATAEQDQLTILESIAVVERDVYTSCRELGDIRMQYNQCDIQIMDSKKMIDGQEQMKCDLQNISLAQFDKIKEMSDHYNALSIECVNQQKQIDSLILEAQVNEENINKSNELLHITSEKYNEVSHKVMEVDKEITIAKDQLMQLDEELNYMEQCNDRHKQNQAFMHERMQKETSLVQENTMRISECEIAISQFDKEAEVIRIELDGLHLSTQDQYERKQQLQIEISSLHQHQGCLAQTNKELSIELESFVAADMEVQTFLNKKAKVETIKARADQELQVTLADAAMRKEQVIQSNVHNQQMMMQAAMERKEQMERHAAMEHDHKQMQMEKRMAHDMHQQAMEKQMAIDRVHHFDKENMMAATHMARLSPVRRHSPQREFIIARRSVSPHKRDSPLRSSLYGQNYGYNTFHDKKYSYLGPSGTPGLTKSMTFIDPKKAQDPALQKQQSLSMGDFFFGDLKVNTKDLDKNAAGTREQPSAISQNSKISPAPKADSKDVKQVTIQEASAKAEQDKDIKKTGGDKNPSAPGSALLGPDKKSIDTIGNKQQSENFNKERGLFQM